MLVNVADDEVRETGITSSLNSWYLFLLPELLVFIQLLKKFLVVTEPTI
jgi:hypothetical protein